MIVSLTGTVSEATPVRAVLNVQGVGYEVLMPISTAQKLPGIGETAKLLTVAVYREDSQTLYGFATEEERGFFRLLVEKVSGIGPKIALSILSRMDVSSLTRAIANSDVKALSSCPGIGKKTAERLVVELKDKVKSLGAGGATLSMAGSSSTTGAIDAASSARLDAVAALIALGMKESEAEKAIQRASDRLGSSATSEELVRAAFV